MKHIFLGLFVLMTIISSSQVKLGMDKIYTYTPNDTVPSGTAVSLKTVIHNKGNTAFTGTISVIAKIDSAGLGTLIYLTSNILSVTLNPNDSTSAILSFTATAGQNGFKSSGNGNLIVVWPISKDIQTVDSLSTILVIDNPAGIIEYNSSSFSLYPNPANDKIYINQLNGIRCKQIIIYDVLAREIKQEAYSEIIDIKDLQTGIYWILISNGEKSYRQKFIKQ